MTHRIGVFFVIGLLASFALSGCTSYTEIKDMAIEHRYEHPHTLAEPLSACMLDQLLEQRRLDPIYRVFDSRRDKWFIMGEISSGYSGGSGVYMYSLSFGDGPAGSIIELRSVKTIWGRLHAPKEYIEQSLRECAVATARTAE